MKVSYLLIFLLHFATVCLYLTATSFIFINYYQADPIGAGLQQVACLMVHLLLTALICLIVRLKAVDKKDYNAGYVGESHSYCYPVYNLSFFCKCRMEFIMAYAWGRASLILLRPFHLSTVPR